MNEALVVQKILKGAAGVLHVAGQLGGLLGLLPSGTLPPKIAGAGLLVAEVDAAETQLTGLKSGESFAFPPFHLDVDGAGPNKGGTLTLTYTAD